MLCNVFLYKFKIIYFIGINCCFRSNKLKPFWLSITEKESVPLLDFLSAALLSVEYERALNRALSMPECRVVPFFGSFLRDLRDILSTTPSLVVLAPSGDRTQLEVTRIIHVLFNRSFKNKIVNNLTANFSSLLTIMEKITISLGLVRVGSSIWIRSIRLKLWWIKLPPSTNTTMRGFVISTPYEINNSSMYCGLGSCLRIPPYIK